MTSEDFALTDETAIAWGQHDSTNVSSAAILLMGDDPDEVNLYAADKRVRWRIASWDDPFEYHRIKEEIFSAVQEGILTLDGGEQYFADWQNKYYDGDAVLGSLNTREFVEWGLTLDYQKMHPLYVKEATGHICVKKATPRSKKRRYAKADDTDIVMILVNGTRLYLEQKLEEGDTRNANKIMCEYLEREAPGITENKSKGGTLDMILRLSNFKSDRTRYPVQRFVDKKKK